MKSAPVLQFDRVTHTYSVGSRVFMSVTEALKLNGYIDTTWFDTWTRERGRMIHEYTAMYDRGLLDTSCMDPVVIPYMEAYWKFLRETGFEVFQDYIEKPMVSVAYGFAGTPDRIGKLFGDRSIVDFKSGRVADWVALQTGGYAILDSDQWNSPNRTTAKLKRYGLELRGDGNYALREFADRRDRAVFMGVLTSALWKKSDKSAIWVRN